MGGASRWWLHHSLKALQAQLKKFDVQLIVREGPSLTALRQLIQETAAEKVYWTRRYEPYAMQRDADIQATLCEEGIDVQIFGGALLFEPWTILTKQHKPFQVFTPFWNCCLKQIDLRTPLPGPHYVLIKC